MSKQLYILISEVIESEAVIQLTKYATIRSEKVIIAFLGLGGHRCH